MPIFGLVGAAVLLLIVGETLNVERSTLIVAFVVQVLGVERSAFASSMFITPIFRYSITPTDSDLIRMRQLDEDILERSPALSELAHRPMAFNREPENLFAHVRT